MADKPGLEPESEPRAYAGDSMAARAPGCQHADEMQRMRLVTFSRPAMEGLHQQLGSPTLAVLLADNSGSILSMVGASAIWRQPLLDDPATARELVTEVSPSPAELLPLACPGTVRRSLHVPRRPVLGVAAPILAHDGGVLGIVDFATSPFENFSHANALLRTTAAIIEHRLIESDARGFLVLRFHTRAGVLGSPLEALAVFDSDSRLLARNRVASGLLAIDRLSEQVCCPDCFDTQWGGLVDRACVSAPQTFMLRAQHGGEFFARASLR